MSLLKETIRLILQENAEEAMFIKKLNMMLDQYEETVKHHDYSKNFYADDSLHRQVIELATSLGLEEHPELKIWGGVNEDGEVLISGVTQEEAMSLTDDGGVPIRTDGERSGRYFIYYDV